MNLPTIRVPAWQAHAACRQHEPDMFHPPESSRGLEAKAVCRGCPVRAACLEYALTFEDAHPGSRWGIYGGRNPDERRRIAAKARRKARG